MEDVIVIGSNAALEAIHQVGIRAADRSSLAVRPNRGRVCVRCVAVVAVRDRGGTEAGLLTSRAPVHGVLRSVLDRSDAALSLQRMHDLRFSSSVKLVLKLLEPELTRHHAEFIMRRDIHREIHVAWTKRHRLVRRTRC